MNNSRFISEGKQNIRSRLIKAMKQGADSLESYEIKPDGVFGSEAKIVCGDVTINSNDLDLEFTVNFDDDMEANEAEIIIYNLSQTTIKQFKNKSKITITAGYKGDTGILFKGYVTKVTTKRENADAATTIKCLDDIEEHTITETTYGAGTYASAILKDLLKKTGLTIAVFNMRYDHSFENEQKVDGDLMANIKKYSEVCGVSTYIKNGEIYSRHIKEGDYLYFDLSEDTGLIGSPEEFEEEQTVKEDVTEVINGYECDMLLQHRISAGAKVNLKSQYAKGECRVCSGQHIFNETEAITHIKMY